MSVCYKVSGEGRSSPALAGRATQKTKSSRVCILFSAVMEQEKALLHNPASFKPQLCHTGAMTRLCVFESQVILCLLENCSPSMCDMSQQLSPNWSTTGFQLPGIHGSSADSALLWQSIPYPSLAVIFQSAICFRQEVCGAHKATDKPNCSLGFGQGLFQQMTARTPTGIIKSTRKSGNNCFEHAQAALLRSSYLKMWPQYFCSH